MLTTVEMKNSSLLIGKDTEGYKSVRYQSSFDISRALILVLKYWFNS